MAPFIIGGIMVVLGALLGILVPLKIKNKNIEIRFMQTTPLEELKAILAGNAEAGLEGYRHYVELKGQAYPEKPLKAPYSGKDVAYYNADLYQVYEQVKTSTGKTGNMQSVEKSESLVTNNKSTGNILLADPSSGQKAYVDISQSGLQLDTLKTFDKFEPVNSMQPGGVFRNYPYKAMGARTLGFRMSERTIPERQPLFVLGDARLENDRIIVGRPLDARKPFIVSVREKSDIVSGNKTGANVALVFGILIALAGILVMIFIK